MREGNALRATAGAPLDEADDVNDGVPSCCDADDDAAAAAAAEDGDDDDDALAG